MFHQQINLPLIFESIDINNLNLSEVLKAYQLKFHRVLILTGDHHSLYFANRILASNSDLSIELHTNTKSNPG